MNNQNIMELFEQEPNNRGPYTLKNEGDKAYFTFQQELRKNKN